MLAFIGGMWGMALLAARPGSEGFRLRFVVSPAVQKSSAGPQRQVAVEVTAMGEKEGRAVLTMAGESKEVDLSGQAPMVAFDLAEADSPRTWPVVLAVDGQEKARAEVVVEPARHWQVNLVQHTHTDIGYTRSQTEILAEHLRYIDYALDYCDATDDYPEPARFRWTCEAAWAVGEYLEKRPAEQAERLRKRIQEGRIELGAMYLNFDELPGERLLASSLSVLEDIRKHGMRVELAMQNDVNGIGWCFGEFFPDAGVKYLNMGTHGHRALICFDKPTVFRWESPSGKTVLAYRAEHYHQGNYFGVHAPEDFARFEKNLLDYLQQLAGKGYPYDVCVLQHSGYLTDNAPPSTKSCEMVRLWNEKYEWPKLRTAVATDFFKEVERNYAGLIPTIRGAWPDWWTDGFASGAREAAVFRKAQAQATAVRSGLSLALMACGSLPEGTVQDLEAVDEALLFYGEHTFGYCESVRDPYGADTWEQRSLKQSYAWEAHRRAGLSGETAMGILQAVVPKAEVPSIAVFNTLNWARSGVARVYVDHQILPRGKAFEITDARGNRIPAQAGESRSDGTYWNLYVKEVPPLGFARYFIRVGNEPAAAFPAEERSERVENDWYAIDFDFERGTIRRIYDKELGKELLDGETEWGFGEFIYETIDDRGALEQRRFPRFTRRHPEKLRFDAFEKGEIWDAYRFKGETAAGVGADNLVVEYRVFHVEKRIEVVYGLRKKDVTDPEGVYVAFPYRLDNGKIYLEVPGGVMEAGTEQIPGSSNDWYTVQGFAAARSAEGQIVTGSPEIPLMQFGAINTGRYQAGAVPQGTAMYSWPMNNYWTTNFNADQFGGLEWSYFMTSSTDPSPDYATRFAWGCQVPFLTRVLQAGQPDERSGGQSVASLLTVAPSNLLLVDMKPLEGNSVMLQLREIAGRQAVFSASSPVVDLRKPVACDATGRECPSKDGVTFKPWETRFVKLRW